MLYIAAWGRSGTTILDNSLGQLDGFFSAGELHYLFKRGLVERRVCGCGRVPAECDVWSQILARALPEIASDPGAADRLVALQEDVVSLRRTPWLLRSGRGDVGSDARMRRYAEVLGSVYRTIAEVTGASVVVDSSKRPSDAAFVRLLSGVDAYFLHVVRDPRAVAYSWERRKPQPDRAGDVEMVRHGVVDSTFNWVIWNAAIERLRGRHNPAKSMRLRYEDFTSRPRLSFERIVDMLGESPGAGPFVDERTVTLLPNHTVSGNPSRFKTGTITLSEDDEWRRRQRLSQRAVASIMALPLLSRYSYSFRPSSGSAPVNGS